MSNVSNFSVTNGIGIIEINSPPVNALSIHVRKAIISGLEQAWSDDEVEAIVIPVSYTHLTLPTNREV